MFIEACGLHLGSAGGSGRNFRSSTVPGHWCEDNHRQDAEGRVVADSEEDAEGNPQLLRMYVRPIFACCSRSSHASPLSVLILQLSILIAIHSTTCPSSIALLDPPLTYRARSPPQDSMHLPVGQPRCLLRVLRQR